MGEINLGMLVFWVVAILKAVQEGAKTSPGDDEEDLKDVELTAQTFAH